VIYCGSPGLPARSRCCRHAPAGTSPQSEHGLAEPGAIRLQSFAAGAEPEKNHAAEPAKYNHAQHRCLDGRRFTLVGVIVMAVTKKKGKRKVEIVFLVCEETGDYNYTIRRKSGGEKLKVKKYSRRLRRHTVHVEKKK
jgi:large subunit ribosomal protein L33